MMDDEPITTAQLLALFTSLTFPSISKQVHKPRLFETEEHPVTRIHHRLASPHIKRLANRYHFSVWQLPLGR